MTELYKKYRPTSFGQLVGQDDVVRVLNDLGRRGAMPHTLLLSGPSGCGKTTVARILRRKLKCSDMDFHEVNVADFRGIDMVRDIRARMMLSPQGGRCRIWLIDEAHQSSSDAQDAFLKILEDTPSHVYFILCTTNPQKLKPTIRTRATHLVLKPLNARDMLLLLHRVVEAEDGSVPDAVLERIAERAEGSPRRALVLLDEVIGLDGEEHQLGALARLEADSEAVGLARLLLKPNATWPEVAKLLRELESQGEDAEGLRWMLLGYCKKVLLGGGKLSGRAAQVIDRCQDDFYSSKWAGLVLACHDVVSGGHV